jgi:hypothetical protein
MAVMELKLSARIAWWARPALCLVMAAVFMRVSPRYVDRCIDIIVDKGIKIGAPQD